ncbi:hypothetical protein [Croceitalea rosinachiae]|uniref:Four helix bundle protein n=1 Tax=Croceitalea rosinachiae TaxID=3075596 RepID=A0ABU3ADC7_9FLAO|nr:hypothetical protein [Croceitalea sp. F388]MDT0608186.1 hypothetical protein [Croceitalea sp. F388]
MKNSSFNTLPVYQKSLVLKDLSTAIANYFSYDSDFFTANRKSGLRADIAKALCIDASLISSTIEKATSSKSTTTRSKNIVFINIMTRNILSYCNGLENDGVKEKEYINLLRKEIKTFKSYFKQWRKSLHSGDE